MSYPNARQFIRAATKMHVEIRLGPDRTIEGLSTSDVSMNGVFIAGLSDLEVGLECTVTIRLSGEPEGPAIEASARVSRVSEQGVGFRFQEVALDGYEHLRNLVIANAVDADQAEEEFERSVGLKPRG